MFRPAALLFVGVAGGLSGDLSLGDVVVATRVYAYHGGKDDSSGFHARPRAWDAPHDLEQLARYVSRRSWWTGEGPPPPVHFKPVAAGEVVLDTRTTPLAAQLRDHYNDAAAVEMESAGVSQAGHLNHSQPVLTVRGISDHADGAKQAADGAQWQPVAARNAAAFAMEICRELRTSSTADGTIPTPGAAAGPTQSIVASTGGTAFGALGGNIHIHHGSSPPAALLPSGRQDTDAVTGVGWRMLPTPVPVVWRTGATASTSSAMWLPATLELHLVPVGHVELLEVRRLPALADQLAAVGRAERMFGVADALVVTPSPDAAAVVHRDRDGAERGVVITRDGRRSAWLPLPHDALGSVLDETDLVEKLSWLLALLAALDLPWSDEVAPAVGIEPVGQLSEGEVAAMPRSTASHAHSQRPHLRIPAAEALPRASLGVHAPEVVAELAARVLAHFRLGR